MAGVRQNNPIIQVLMNRDGMTYEEACEVYSEARAELYEAIEGTSVLTPEEVLECELGLEPDYLFDLL